MHSSSHLYHLPVVSICAIPYLIVDTCPGLTCNLLGHSHLIMLPFFITVKVGAHGHLAVLVPS